jgi:hypothetical protein
VRAMSGAADALIVGGPPVVAFALWALVSWLIVGSPFETFSSVYGNSSQVALSRDAIRDATGDSPGATLTYLVNQVRGLEPAIVAIIAGAIAAALARRDLRIVAPIVVFGGVVAISGVFFLAGSSFGWLRFSIAAIPLAVMAAAVAIGALRRPGPQRWPERLSSVPAIGLVALALAAIPLSINTLFDPRLAREEAYHLRGLVAPGAIIPDEQRRFEIGRDVAQYLDAQNLPRGSVVVDVALGFWVVLQSEHPEQFVITPDRDFEPIVADPAMFDARYVLVSPASGLGGFGAVERAHPGLYQNGAGIGELAAEFVHPTDGDVAWRVYEVTPK